MVSLFTSSPLAQLASPQVRAACRACAMEDTPQRASQTHLEVSVLALFGAL